MGALKAVGIDAIMKRGSIKDIDVLELRKAFYNDSSISVDEAQLLFAVNKASPVQDPSWAPFFIEAITDFIVNQAEPEGYLTADNAAWLISRCATNDAINSYVEFEMVVNVLERARWSPESLISFAMHQVLQAVTSGEGPLRIDGLTQKNQITNRDVGHLRRIVFAFGGDGHVGITRSEAEILFAINDAVDSSDTNPVWTDFFVKAIANTVMAASGYAMPTRADALKEGAWLESRDETWNANLVGAFGSITNTLKEIIGLYSEQTPEDRALARLERQRIEIITNEQITEGEAEWLAARLSRDSQLTVNERALVEFLNRESPSVHPVLKAACDRICHAA
jgi:hypothetical protein